MDPRWGAAVAKRGTETRRLTAQLNVRLPVEVLARVRAVATTTGITDAAWTRALVVQTLAASSSMPPPTRRPRARPTPDLIAVARLREAIGEAVGTLRQVAGLDRGRSGARLEEIDDAISRLTSAARALDETKAELLGRAS